MNVIGYIRVSTDGQCGDDKYGLESQRQQIVAYCEKNGHTIDHWVSDEGESGAKERPGFDEIVYSSEIGNPPIEAVVVAKSDRVARDINIYYYYKMLLRKKDMQLISIAEDFGQFGVFAAMLEAFTMCCAELERENINKRMSGGRAVKSRSGGYSGGRAPYGYSVKDGGLVINEKEASVVREIFRLREQNGMAYKEIAAVLAREGIVSRGGKPLLFTTVASILDNRKTYEGYYRYGKNSDGTRKDNWVEGQHEAILERR